ncbi:hypothetical protein R3P38DRAFT_3183389 [Favolaschia claudopus]|uniref:Uncharacterized protein n=1 Tax=Favolaschia claudopus TaxID=2862362 RepID=A0AAW0C7R9_9AGAR
MATDSISGSRVLQALTRNWDIILGAEEQSPPSRPFPRLSPLAPSPSPPPSSPPPIRRIHSRHRARPSRSPSPRPSSPPPVRQIASTANKRYASTPPSSPPPLRRRRATSPSPSDPSAERSVCVTTWLRNDEKPVQILLPVWRGELCLANHQDYLETFELRMGTSRMERFTHDQGWEPLMWAVPVQIGNGTNRLAVRLRSVDALEDWDLYQDDF